MMVFFRKYAAASNTDVVSGRWLFSRRNEGIERANIERANIERANIERANIE